MRERIINRIVGRIGEPKAGDRARAGEIVDRVYMAQRQAQRLHNADAPGGGRLPKPSEIPVVPGTRPSEADGYSYTVVVTYYDPAAGARRSFTHVVRSDTIIPYSEVVSRTQAAIARGQIISTGGYKGEDHRDAADPEINVISAYRGDFSG